MRDQLRCEPFDLTDLLCDDRDRGGDRLPERQASCLALPARSVTQLMAAPPELRDRVAGAKNQPY